MNKTQLKAIEVAERKQARIAKKLTIDAERDRKRSEREIKKLTKMLVKDTLKQSKVMVRQEAKAIAIKKKEADRTLVDMASMFRNEERKVSKK